LSALRLALVGLAALAGAGCRSGGASDDGPPALDVAAAALDLGEVETVERALEPQLADGAPQWSPEDRFWSCWLLAQAKALRALDLSNDWGADVSAERTGLEVNAAYFAGLAANAALRADGNSHAPGSPELGFEQAALGLELLRVSLLERLGFSERAQWRAAQIPGLASTGEIARELEQSGLHERLHARVWWALFQERSRRDPAGAFPFAVAALRAADPWPGSLDAEEVRGVEGWIQHGAPFAFRCPECSQAAIPELRGCPNDQTALERFEAGPRP
jgi:hypothetical protein